MGPSAIPNLDDSLRRRMVARYGGDVESWLDELPPVLAQLAERWQIELGSLIPRGHMSVVIRCRTADRNPAVLKVCYDRARLATEAAALQGWNTRHVPSVLAVDTTIGALLMEAIVPGTMLLESLTFPVLDVATLLTSLHETGSVDRSYPLLERRVAYLFDAWARHLTRQPELRQVVSPDLFERGRRLASRLAEQRTPMVLLHGDLTAVNVLYGGEQRGLVAIDPAPCLGDPAFDAIDLVVGPGLPADLWCTDDVAVISARAASVAHMIGVDARTYRHFPTNEDLETAAWISITQHFTHVDSTPKTLTIWSTPYATAWDLLRSFWSLDASQAADVIELAIQSLIDGLRHRVPNQDQVALRRCMCTAT